MLGDGVIADEAHTALRPEVPQDKAGQQRGEGQAGPLGQGEHAVVAGRVARGEAGDGAEQVGNGAPAGGQDGGHAQQFGADEGGSRGKGRLEQREHGQGLVGYSKHEGLRVREA
jgi:hypothetical protein